MRTSLPYPVSIPLPRSVRTSRAGRPVHSPDAANPPGSPVTASLAQAVRDEPLPALLLDLRAFDANAATVLARAAGRPVRVASKSLRTPLALRRLLGRPGFRGLMTFSPRETEWLAREGFDDLLLAYPVARPPEARAVARAAKLATVRCVFDDEVQIRALSEAAVAEGVTLRLCLDVDASLRVGGRHLGVRRSPVRTPERAVRLARAARAFEGLVLDAVMAYEAQVAGLADRAPDDWLPVRWGKQWVKTRSVPHVAALRGAVVEALRAQGFEVAVVNGGGTGSLATTAADPAVTEVTAGSGFYAPHLFDGYDGLALVPALFLALPVVRASDAGFVTVAGGGIAASGEAGPSRLPVVVHPPGLRPLPREGFGEVQTPLTGPVLPALGDVVLARPAKAGEPTAAFGELLVVDRDRVVERWPTYRGVGVVTG